MVKRPRRSAHGTTSGGDGKLGGDGDTYDYTSALSPSDGLAGAGASAALIYAAGAGFVTDSGDLAGADNGLSGSDGGERPGVSGAVPTPVQANRALDSSRRTSGEVGSPRPAVSMGEMTGTTSVSFDTLLSPTAFERTVGTTVDFREW